MLRKEAGFSHELSREKVKGLKKFTDGKREKVKAADVKVIIQESIRPTPFPKVKIRPFRKSIIDQIERNLKK